MSNVDYGDLGVLRFVDQIVIRAASGQFSAAGDSGSFILTKDGNRPYCLLFAGGGSDTIANPIKFVMEMFGIEFFFVSAP